MRLSMPIKLAMQLMSFFSRYMDSFLNWMSYSSYLVGLEGF